MYSFILLYIIFDSKLDFTHSEPLDFFLYGRSHIKCYVFVSQLEALNVPYTVQSFLSSPKEALVKGLWKKQSHEPQVSHHHLAALRATKDTL